MLVNILTKSQIVYCMMLIGFLEDAGRAGSLCGGSGLFWRRVSPICIGGSSNTNSDSWSNPQARSLLTRTWCPDIYFVLVDHVVDVYTSSSVIAEDWLFWWCEEGVGGVVVHFSSALHQFVVSHFCPQPHSSHTVTLINLPLYITVCLQFLLCIFFCMCVFVSLCVSSLNICVFICVCVYSDMI